MSAAHCLCHSAAALVVVVVVVGGCRAWRRRGRGRQWQQSSVW